MPSACWGWGGGGQRPGLLPASHCNAARGGNLLNALHLLQPLLRALRHVDCKTHSAWRVTGHPPGLPCVIPGHYTWLGLGLGSSCLGGELGLA